MPAKPGQSAEPSPAAGRGGTQIVVEDLFYNVPTRRRAFRSPSDEYNKIIDMVGRYAVHCGEVAFSCKKHGESTSSISVQSTATVVDRIRHIYGGAVANDLIEYSTSDDRWGFKADGRATNANYHASKTTFLLFINHRCVESSNIRKAVEQTYASFLPKNGRPFVYLSLEIDPGRVDVNVHPTKREVNFLNEDEIIQAVCENIRSKLAAVDTSRTFTTQALLPGGTWNSPDPRRDATATPSRATGAAAKKTPARPYENNLVRTDASLRKITSMLQPVTPAAGASPSSRPGREATIAPGGGGDAQPPEAVEYETVDREATPCRLASVRELRAAVRDDMHHELTEVLANHTFVGLVDDRRRLAAVQGGVKLYLVDYGRVALDFLYQVGLTDFANFGVIRFSPALDLRELLAIAARHELAGPAAPDEDDGDGKGRPNVETVVTAVADQLIERRQMLHEYFSLEISPAGELVSIPLLIKGYTPSVAKLPRFLLRLGPHVDWTDETACFDSFLRELAAFYVPEQLPPPPAPDRKGKGVAAPDGADDGPGADAAAHDVEARRRHVRWAVEHVFFPAFRARLVATKTLMKAGGVVEVANLRGLYRVFERC